MKKNAAQPLLRRNQPNITYAAPIVVILLLVGILAALLLNTAGMHKSLRQNAVDYANDVSAQLASNISYRMRTREIHVRNLADTISGMPASRLTGEMLARKAEYLEMEDLFVLNPDGTTIPADEEHASLSGYLAKHPELYKDPTIFSPPTMRCFFPRPSSARRGRTPCSLGPGPTPCCSRCSRTWIFRTMACAASWTGTGPSSFPPPTRRPLSG